MFCPKTFKPCIDDLCRGGAGCFLLGGEPLYEYCPGCKNLVSSEDREDCTCEPDEFEWDECDECGVDL